MIGIGTLSAADNNSYILTDAADSFGPRPLQLFALGTFFGALECFHQNMFAWHPKNENTKTVFCQIK
jgi:hypothetical protein